MRIAYSRFDLKLKHTFMILDGNVLISNDPFDGVKIKEGKLILPERPGIGVVKRSD